MLAVDSLLASRPQLIRNCGGDNQRSENPMCVINALRRSAAEASLIGTVLITELSFIEK
jgi:hypothetical protein